MKTDNGTYVLLFNPKHEAIVGKSRDGEIWSRVHCQIASNVEGRGYMPFEDKYLQFKASSDNLLHFIQWCSKNKHTMYREGFVCMNVGSLLGFDAYQLTYLTKERKPVKLPFYLLDKPKSGFTIVKVKLS
jgi:hypothetical protein